jgi:DNA-binding NarL/FixJ family response regulator
VRAVLVGQVAIPAERREALAQPILSPREKQVLSMVVLGFTNREVANKLHVTETTVKSHLSSAYRKLRVRSRHEATALILSDKSLGLGILTLSGAPTTV